MTLASLPMGLILPPSCQHAPWPPLVFLSRNSTSIPVSHNLFQSDGSNILLIMAAIAVRCAEKHFHLFESFQKCQTIKRRTWEKGSVWSWPGCSQTQARVFIGGRKSTKSVRNHVRLECNLKLVIGELISKMDINSYEIALRWMPSDHIDD